MDEKYLKTTWGQRLAILAIALLLLGITVATYIGLVLSNSSSSSSSSTSSSDDSSNSALDEIYERYAAKSAELDSAAAEIAPQYFDDLLSYKSSVKAYNEESANNSGLQSEDLRPGEGAEITEEWNDYYAYYIGYCPDETIFDSSFDNSDSPTTLKAPISGAQSLIVGWTQGVLGMKVGGVRQLTIPGELAYGESQEICGGTNKPLRFIVMAIEPGETVRSLSNDLTDIIAEYNAAALAQ